MTKIYFQLTNLNLTGQLSHKRTRGIFLKYHVAIFDIILITNVKNHDSIICIECHIISIMVTLLAPEITITIQSQSRVILLSQSQITSCVLKVGLEQPYNSAIF